MSRPRRCRFSCPRHWSRRNVTKVTDKEIETALDEIDDIALGDTAGAAMLALEGLWSRVGRDRVEHVQAGRMKRLRKQARRELNEHSAAGLPLHDDTVPEPLRMRFWDALHVGKVRREADRGQGRMNDRTGIELIEANLADVPWWGVTCFHGPYPAHTYVFPAEVIAVARYETLEQRLKHDQPLHEPELGS